VVHYSIGAISLLVIGYLAVNVPKIDQFRKNIFPKEGKISIQACVTILVNIQKAYMVTYKDWAKKKNGVPNQK
jgi:hypothetical protein